MKVASYTHWDSVNVTYNLFFFNLYQKEKLCVVWLASCGCLPIHLIIEALFGLITLQFSFHDCMYIKYLRRIWS